MKRTLLLDLVLNRASPLFHGNGEITRWRREQPAEGHLEVGDAEDVLPLDLQRAILHLRNRHPRSPRGADERADAAPDHRRRRETVLLQGPQHADMGEPLEPTAAEDGSR